MREHYGTETGIRTCVALEDCVPGMIRVTAKQVSAHHTQAKVMVVHYTPDMALALAEDIRAMALLQKEEECNAV